MRLYLVRHGQAEETGGDDRYRRLSERGQADAERLAETLGRIGVHVEMVYHSGLTRAHQTATILHTAVGGQIEAASGLTPMDDISSFARRIESAESRSLMLVGHQPFMGSMAAYLLTGDVDADIVHFRTASIACLAGVETTWQLEWFLEPHIL